MCAHASETNHAVIGTYPQEVAFQYTVSDGLPSKEITHIEILADGRVAALTAEGLSVLADGAWAVVAPDALGQKSRQALFDRARNHLNLRNPNAPGAISVNDVGAFDDGRLLIAASDGLKVLNPDNSLLSIPPYDQLGRRWGTDDVRAVAIHGNSFWFAVMAGVVRAEVNQEKGTIELKEAFAGEDGLPYNDFTCASAGGEGSAWFGTTKGVIRLRDGEFAYRQGRRWLPDDHVTDILAMPDGSAWVATKGGVAHLTTRPMTFAEKAQIYEADIELIKRTEYGYVAEATVTTPGDKSEIHHHDSDNDGLWTAMYGAGECFAYAATNDPKAKARAKQAFEALRFLQKVTQGGEHSPPRGYVARTILPTSGPDPNIGRIERDREEQATGDKLWKVYEPRWPKSADGKWYWKSDTSSDELDGHYFFYPAYYDLVAETEAEQERVREVVRDLTDHLIDHGFRLIDHDGKVTRWGDYSPESLNGDRRWWVERGLNSLSMLSYLAVAEHMTGDSKYGEVSRMLCEKHHYDQNAMVAKIQFGIGSGNQSDDEMAFMSYYNLIKYTKDPKLREMIQHSLYQYWKLEFPEMNSFFNVVYAQSCLGAKTTTQWGVVDLGPYAGWLEDSVATLKGFPLDRFNWGHENSHRLDIVPLRRWQAKDPDDRNPPRRGLRVNDKVLPVEERHFNHWNTDPYDLDYGGNGRGLASGTVFLLPYYMGLYHGFIE